MHGPSGFAIVTGLAGLGLSYVVWTWDTRPLQPLPQQLASMPEASSSDLEGLVQLHSVAWRTLPASIEETATQSAPPPSVQAADPALDIQFPGTLLSATAAPIGPFASRTVRTIPEPVAASLQTPLPAASESEPPAPVPAVTDLQSAATVSQSSEGRMALSGPKTEVSEPAPTHAHRQARPVPEPTAQVEAPPATENKFGPAAFKGFERNGF
jgi:cytoskeletal protein RodZ